MSDQEPTARPQKPLYGELAPEGWSWTPPGENADASEHTSAAKPSTDAALEEAATTGEAVNTGASAAAATPGEPAGNAQPPTNQGVPHNLGVGSEASAPQPAQQQAPINGQSSYRPTAPPQGSGLAPENTGRGDRVITMVLLAIGTFGALYLAMSMMVLSSSFNLIASILEVKDFTTPSSVQTLGTTGALIVLALYAIMLIFSIQRLRARKLAFWIPLAAGALAVIVVLAIMMIAISQMPELLAVLSDPDAAAQLLNSGALLGK